MSNVAPQSCHQLTLCLIRNQTHILLGLKKRGFGQGRWNGFGGKVEHGESIVAAACREVKEEIDLTVTSIKKSGRLFFTFQDKPQALDVHVFEALSFHGTPIETEEMKPHWFALVDIPYPAMWADDRHWLPLFLAGIPFEGSFLFQDNDRLLKHTLNSPPNFPNEIQYVNRKHEPIKAI